MNEEIKPSEDVIKSARNYAIALAVFSILPIFMFALILFLSRVVKEFEGISPSLDTKFTIIFIVLSISFIISVIAAIHCHKGKESGRIIAQIAAIVLLPLFPFGTYLGVSTLIRFNSAKIKNAFNESAHRTR